jgi:hypothetical protein
VVHERGLAVVHVGDDGDVAQRAVFVSHVSSEQPEQPGNSILRGGRSSL